eukprot:m.35809 g.35809  ORF g.35809 m.35809 type:complete len:123 (+) comp17205_c1_seq2:80-448(+)
MDEPVTTTSTEAPVDSWKTQVIQLENALAQEAAAETLLQTEMNEFKKNIAKIRSSFESDIRREYDLASEVAARDWFQKDLKRSKSTITQPTKRAFRESENGLSRLSQMVAQQMATRHSTFMS